MNIAVKTVPLSKTERIVFDVQRNIYRLVYYRPKLKNHKIVGEDRFTAKHKDLYQALCIALGEGDSKHDPLTIEVYIRSTSWGKQLP